MPCAAGRPPVTRHPSGEGHALNKTPDTDADPSLQDLIDRHSALAMDGEAFRALGHRLVDRIAGFLDTLPERPAAPDLSPAAARELVGHDTLPAAGGDPAALLDQAADLVINGSRLNGHPRSWGYVIGTPAPIGMLGDLLAAATNPNLAAWRSSPVATEMEAQVVRWIAELLGYPTDCGGLLTSGGNMANFIGFLAARRAKANWDVRGDGMAGGPGPQLCAYASEETHTWIQKAADLFGLGTGAIRWIPTDAGLRMDLAALRDAIEQDRARGDRPFLVVGAAGTVSTGAVDPLPAIAAIAREHDLWFHVDGAYGAFAGALDETPADLKGLREADSLAVDAHKWLYAPLEAGCALVRDRRALLETFSYRPSYYYHGGADEEEGINYYEYGPQNSRCFRALKVWLVLRHIGRQDYLRLVGEDVRLAQQLYRAVEMAPELEAVTQGLSITTFRYVPPDLDPAADGAADYLNRLNKTLVSEIQTGGEAFLSNAVVGGRYLLRACITNFRTRLSDVEALPGIATRLGRAIHARMRDGSDLPAP